MELICIVIRNVLLTEARKNSFLENSQKKVHRKSLEKFPLWKSFQVP